MIGQLSNNFLIAWRAHFIVDFSFVALWIYLLLLILTQISMGICWVESPHRPMWFSLAQMQYPNIQCSMLHNWSRISCLASGATEVCWLRHLFQDLAVQFRLSPKLFRDPSCIASCFAFSDETHHHFYSFCLRFNGQRPPPCFSH